MKLLSLFAFMLSTLLLSACGGGGGGLGGDPFHPTLTLYNGSYSGADSGTFRVTIDPRGEIIGEATSSSSSGSVTFTVSGKLNGTEVRFTAANASTTSVFTGTVDRSGNMTGTWTYAGTTVGGTFAATS